MTDPFAFADDLGPERVIHMVCGLLIVPAKVRRCSA